MDGEPFTATPAQLFWMRHSHQLSVDRLRALDKMTYQDMTPADQKRLRWLEKMQAHVLERVNTPVPITGAGLVVATYMRDMADAKIAARADGSFGSATFSAWCRARRERLASELSEVKEAV